MISFSTISQLYMALLTKELSEAGPFSLADPTVKGAQVPTGSKASVSSPLDPTLELQSLARQEGLTRASEMLAGLSVPLSQSVSQSKQAELRQTMVRILTSVVLSEDARGSGQPINDSQPVVNPKTAGTEPTIALSGPPGKFAPVGNQRTEGGASIGKATDPAQSLKVDVAPTERSGISPDVIPAKTAASKKTPGADNVSTPKAIQVSASEASTGVHATREAGIAADLAELLESVVQASGARDTGGMLSLVVYNAAFIPGWPAPPPFTPVPPKNLDEIRRALTSGDVRDEAKAMEYLASMGLNQQLLDKIKKFFKTAEEKMNFLIWLIAAVTTMNRILKVLSREIVDPIVEYEDQLNNGAFAGAEPPSKKQRRVIKM